MLDAVKEEQGQELELLETLDDEQACGEESPSCAAEDAPLVFDVPAGKKPRLDAFLSSMCDESRSRLKKLVEQGRCNVDGQVCTDADQKVRPGQRVELRLPAASNVVVNHVEEFFIIKRLANSNYYQILYLIWLILLMQLLVVQIFNLYQIGLNLVLRKRLKDILYENLEKADLSTIDRCQMK